jgi:hypothetical protein
MTDKADSTDEGRVPPSGDKWQEAQRDVAERNDQTRKAARAQNDADERALAKRRAERERGKVYR